MQVEVIEIDQWTSASNIRDYMFDDVTLSSITSGNSILSMSIFDGWFIRKFVDPDSKPPLGSVWFTKGSDGKCEMWKSHYDSSR